MFSMCNNLFASEKDKTPHLNFPSKVRFVENKNQWENFIRYEADFRGGKIFLEDNRFTYLFYHPDDMQSLHPHKGKQIDKVRLHAVKVNAENANAHPSIKADDPANYCNNYFLGNDASKWATDVKLFSSVTYQNLYPGIDLKFYSSISDIKYDLVVQPGGNTSSILLAYEGADELSLKDGELMMKLSVGDIVEQKPYAYQLINGKETEVDCKFVLHKNKVSFRFPHGFDKTIPLIIDPTLIFSSYSGSSADNWGFTATYDAAGNVYAGGNVNAVGYPVTPGAFQMSYHGGGTGGNGWTCDMSIAKFNAGGTNLLYATYIGGSNNEQPQSLVVDGNDDLVIFGTAYSSNYPVTTGAFQPTYHGNGDMVISKLSSSGNALLASTYLGGLADDGVNIDPSFFSGSTLKYNYGDEARGEIISDASNDYIVGSCTKSHDFPVTAGVMQPAFGGGTQDGVLLKINSSLTGLVWSTYIGGNANDAVYDCVIDNGGSIYFAGGTNSTNFPTTAGVLHQTFQGGIADGFISHTNNGANFLLASTYIGTSSYDQTYFVELDHSGNVYTTGQTQGIYPITAGVYSNPNSAQFIHKMDSGLTTTFYSTVFGSGVRVPNISPTAFLVDTCENVYVAGWGTCIALNNPGDNLGMPVTPNAFQSHTDGCDFYFFVLNHDAATLLYGSYFGGNQSFEHVDGGTSRFNKNGTIYESVCAGCGGFSDFPTTPGVVSRTNNSNNCNNGVIKLAFNLARTVSSITNSRTSSCAPFTLTLTNGSINADHYQWTFDDGSPIDTNFSPTHTFINPGVYHVQLVASSNVSCNLNDTAYATITVTPHAPVIASFNIFQNGCDTLALTQFTGSGGNSFFWNFGDGYTTNSINAAHMYGDTGTYYITLMVRDTSCPGLADTTFQPVTFAAAVKAVVAAVGATQGCAPLPVSFNNSSSASGTHFWDFKDGSPQDTNMNATHVFTFAGTFDVIFVVTDPLSCNKADTAHVLISVPAAVPLVASFSISPNSFCDTLTASTQFNGSGGDAYHWFFGDGFQAAGFAATHTYSSAGTYTILLVAEDHVCNLVDSSTQQITLRQTVHVGINTNNIQFGCVPQTVRLSNLFNSSGNSLWYFGDGTISLSPSPEHIYTDTGTFTIELIVSDTASCNLADTSFYVFKVFANPVAAFSHDVYDLYFIHNDIRFYSQSLNAARYNWDFGDGTFATDSIVLHQFLDAGTFDVCLNVTSSNGCIDSTCAPIDILSSETIYVPTVFTPNGDGKNDEFRVFSFGLTDLDVMIFNRWGEKIYEYTSLNGSWNGEYKGKPSPEDVYVFRLKAKGIVNDDIERYGRVTLVR